MPRQQETEAALNTSQIAHWNRSLAEIIELGPGEAALHALIHALENLVGARSSSVIVYPPGQEPVPACHRLLPDEDPSFHIDEYIGGAYLLDPCYIHALECEGEGLYTAVDVSPDGFEDSEYYSHYYRETKLLDEAFFTVRASRENIILLSLGRHEDSAVFSEQEKALLSTLHAPVKAIINGWFQQTEVRDDGVGRELDRALTRFGTSLLTAREKTVLDMLLRGHSIKSIALNLGNSVETIKHHRKNIYSKLDISSQAELFHLFIDSLRSYPRESDEDPLQGYMTP